MENVEKIVPIGTTIFWGQTATGIFWIGAGLAGMFNNLVCNILSILFLLAGIVALAKVFRIGRNGDDGDEMAEYNYTKAKANAGSVLHIVLCVVSIASVLEFGLMQDLEISWPRIVSNLCFVLMGIHNLLIGLFFRKLEAE